MNIYEYVWIHMNLYEYVWIFMNIYEYVWIFMNIYYKHVWKDLCWFMLIYLIICRLDTESLIYSLLTILTSWLLSTHSLNIYFLYYTNLWTISTLSLLYLLYHHSLYTPYFLYYTILKIWREVKGIWQSKSDIQVCPGKHC